MDDEDAADAPGTADTVDTAGTPTDADRVRQQLAERHFMLSQAVIDRFEELLPFLKEAHRALDGSGHAELARRAAEEVARTEEELTEWQGFRDEVAAVLDEEATSGP